MKRHLAGSTVVALAVLTAGCSSGSGAKAGATSAAGLTSTAAAPTPSGLGASSTAGSAGVTSSGAPAGSTAAPSPSGSQALGSAATTTASASGGASTSQAAGSQPGGKAAPVVVCTTLPAAQVASLSGKDLTSSREQDFAAGNAYTCAYYPASGVGGISVTVTVVGGVSAYANSLNTDTIAGSAEHVTPLSGLGDKAFSARDGVRVLFGDRMIYVAGLTSLQPAEAVIEALQAKLG